MEMRMAAKARAQALQCEPKDIEGLLVWVYRDQKADLVISRGVGLHGLEAAADGVASYASSACGCAAVARIGELGVRVDQAGRDGGALHPDAEVVHRAVMRLTDRVNGLPRSRLIIQNAARGERPDAMVGQVPRPRPLLQRDGRPVVHWTDKGKRYGSCPVQYAPSAAMILAAQAEYSAWHATLRLLAIALQAEGQMTKYWPLPPAAPAAPWLG